MGLRIWRVSIIELIALLFVVLPLERDIEDECECERLVNTALTQAGFLFHSNLWGPFTFMPSQLHAFVFVYFF